MSAFSNAWNAVVADVGSAVSEGESGFNQALAAAAKEAQSLLSQGEAAISTVQTNLLGLLAGAISITDPAAGIVATLAPLVGDFEEAFGPGLADAFPAIQYNGKIYKLADVLKQDNPQVFFGYLAACFVAAPSMFNAVIGGLNGQGLDAADGSDFYNSASDGTTGSSVPTVPSSSVSGAPASTTPSAPATSGMSGDVTSTLSAGIAAIMSFATTIMGWLGLSSSSSNPLTSLLGGSTGSTSTGSASTGSTPGTPVTTPTAAAVTASGGTSILWYAVAIGIIWALWDYEKNLKSKKGPTKYGVPTVNPNDTF